MLRLRILSALVLAPPALAAVWLGGWAFVALVALAAALMGWEWQRLTTGGFGPAGIAASLAGIAAAALGADMPLLALAVVGLVGLGVAGEGLLRQRPATAWLAWGVLYIGVPVVALVWLRGLPEGGRTALVWLFLVIWATDIGAYAAGRTIGGPLLAPRVSPKKTWAGLIGGVASAAIVGTVTAQMLGHVSALPLACYSGALAVVAQIGDLGESWVKRRFGVKDSSNVIPGHGGVFDRVDGLIAAAPVVALAAWAAGEGWLAWK